MTEDWPVTDGGRLRTETERGYEKKVNWEGVREGAVMAESVPENSEEATAEQGGRGGLGVGLSGRPICQIKAPKNLGGGQSSVSPGKSPFLLLKKLKRLESQQRKIQNIHPERPGCAPCLSSPCPWSSVYRNDGEPKWPRHSRPSPRLAHCPSGARPALPPAKKSPLRRWTISATDLMGHDGAVCPHSWKEQQQHTRSQSGEERVPWWQPAVCPAWHGEAKSRTSTSTTFLFIPHCTLTIHAFCIYF